MSTLTVPAAMLPYIRGGAQLQAADAAERLAAVVGNAIDRGIPPSTERRRLSQACALLDELGWSASTGGSVVLDIHEHGEALIGASARDVDRLETMIADLTDDAQRTSREGDLRALREFAATAREAIECDRPKTITTTVPANVIVLLRGALRAELGRACEDAPGTMPESGRRSAWAPVLRRIESAFGGLDAIGWAEPVEQHSMTIAFDAEMVEALEADAELWEWLSEQERTESPAGRARAAARAAEIERFLATLIERPASATLRIPTSAVSLVREGAHTAISDVSEAIDRGVAPRECCRRLSAICDLLDLIGRGGEDAPGADVDATEQAGTVMELATSMLATLTTAVSDLTDGDPSKVVVEDELRLMRQLCRQASETVGG